MRTHEQRRTGTAGGRGGRVTEPDRRCPHGIDHPSWCPTCRTHWRSRMTHPSWPRHDVDDGA